MTDLQKSFLSMIRTALWNDEYECEEGVTSAELFDEACRYEIAGILSTKLDLFCSDGNAEVRSRWSKKAMIDYMKSFSTLTILDSLNGILEPQGIRPVILKGMASSYYYPNAMVRQFGDVDFLVPPEQFKECLNVLLENGFIKTKDNKRHLGLYKQQIDYEMHRFFSMNRTKTDKHIDQVIFEGCRNCISRSVEKKNFYALPEAENGIALLEHMKHHIRTGVGFRQIIDWVVYANASLDDEFWNDSFSSLVRECELEKLAKVVTRMSQIYLGLRTEGITWCSDVDDEVCTALLEFLFSCDNFGFAKAVEEDVHKIDTIVNQGVVFMLDRRAVEHMPIAKKLVFLRPVAWIYQIFRWCFSGIRMLVTYRNFVGNLNDIHNTNRKLFTDIGI